MLDHNSKQPTAASTSTTKTPPVDIEILKQKFAVHFAEYITLGRQTVHAAWLAGEALCAVKAELPHGSFRLYLENQGVNRTTAGNLMRLAREIQMAKLLSFGSVDAALKSIPAKASSRPAVDPDEPSKEEIAGIEQEADRYRADVAEAEVQTARKEIVRLTALSPDAPPAPPPDDDLKQANARASDNWELLEKSRKESLGRKRRLNAIKRDLVDGKSADDILLKHFACIREGAEQQAALGVEDRG